MRLQEAIEFLESKNIAVRHFNVSKDFELSALAPLEQATQTQISYIDQEKYLASLADSHVGAVLVRPNHANIVPAHIQGLEVANPHKNYAQELLESNPTLTIAPNVFIGANVSIGAHTQILPGVVLSDNVSIGAHCKIYPNVVIYRDTQIGDNVSIHAGSVIGSDGFGYAHTNEGEHIKIEHSGRVVIESRVEIGANNTIDRAVFGETRIKSGAIIDNLVQVGHNCVVGENTILVSQVGLAGSTTTGRNVVMGGQAGTGGHIHIGDFVQVAGRGAVGKNLPPNTKWGGHPLMELDEWMKFYVSLRRLLKQKKEK